jgi:ATP-dependent RNA helicase HrpB
VRVSRAAADQRRGRAGRTEPGICYRLWDEPQTAALEAFARPEILAADLSSFALDLAAWGAAPEKLAFLDPPPRAALAEAQTLLRELGALDGDGRITDEGRHLRKLPLPPRLARMVVDAATFGEAQRAAELAALIGERGLGGDDVDLRERRNGLQRDRSRRGGDARAMAARWAEIAEAPARKRAESEMSVGALIALAYPERVAKNRGGGSGAFLLMNGRGAAVDAASPLAREPFLAIAEFTGSATRGRILTAAPIALADIEARFAERIETRDEISFDAASLSLRGRRSRKLGAIVLADAPLQVTANDDTARRLAEGAASVIGRLPWSKALKQWRDRVMFLRASEGDEWPDISDAALAATTQDWLAPALAGKTALGDLSTDELEQAVHTLLPWALRRRLDAEAPTYFTAPTGTQAAIDYEAEGGPKIAIRVQELFGTDRHPSIAGGKIPLVIELLSPAHRPVQTTRDLPGFWRGSYAAVRTEMRGRYPRHPWPDDPIAAPATRRVKPKTT